MRRKLLFLFLRIIVITALLAGLLLSWASFQSFESLALLLNRLAFDGQFESFTPFLYQTLRTPLVLTGIVLILLAGSILFRWERTKRWLETFPARTRIFFDLLRQDRQIFFEDARDAIRDLGHGGIAILVGMMLVALIVRLANLYIPLGHDEAYMYNAFASRSLWHIVSDYHLPNNHVLLSILMKISTGLLGNQVWTLRLPTIVAGVLMVPATYFFTKRFYSRESAALSSILIAVFPILIQYSVYARGYIIIGLITLLLFTLGDYVRTRKNLFAWFLIALLSALGFYTVPVMFFPFGALYIWLLISWTVDDTGSYTSKSNFLKYWLGSGISAALLTVILYMPIIIYSFERFFGNNFIAPLGWDTFAETTWTRLRNTWTEWMAPVPLWIVLLGLLGFFVALIFHKKFTRQKFPPQLAFFIWIATLLLVRRPDMLPRFWLFLAAPLLVWSAAGVVEPLRRVPFMLGKGWNAGHVLTTAILILTFAQGAWTLPALPARWEKKDDMQNAAMYLKEQVRASDLVTASVANLPALRYYFNYYGVPRGTVRQAGNFQHAFIIVDRQLGETLADVTPKMGFDIPVIDMDTARVVIQLDYLTVYEGEPAP